NLDGAVHADGEDLAGLGQVGVDPPMFHVRTVAADPGLHRLAVLRVRPDLAREVEEHQRLSEVHRLRRPALGQARAGRLRVVLGGLAALDIGPEAAGLQPDLLAAILAQHPLRRARLLAVRGGERAGVAAGGVVRAADEGAARPRGLEREPTLAAGRAGARIGPVRPRRV